jgi:hypothetical protein
MSAQAQRPSRRRRAGPDAEYARSAHAQAQDLGIVSGTVTKSTGGRLPVQPWWRAMLNGTQFQRDHR